MNWSLILSGRSFLFGFLLWLIPFVGAFPVFPIKEKAPLVFKALMSVILVAATVGLATAFFRRYRPDITAMTGASVGVVWAIVSLAIDVPLFLLVFKMKPGTYFTEIAIGYLAIPLITWGCASLLESARSGY